MREPRRQAPKIVRIVCRYDGAAKLHRRGHDERVDRMGRPQSRTREYGPGSACHAGGQGHDPDASPVQEPVDGGIERAAATDLREDGRRDADQGSMLVRQLKDCTRTDRKNGPLRRARQCIHRFGIED